MNKLLFYLSLAAFLTSKAHGSRLRGGDTAQLQLEKITVRLNSLSRTLRTQSQQLDEQNKRLSALEGRILNPRPQQQPIDIAFSAVRTSDLSGSTVIPCDRVYINLGGTYSPVTGLVRAIVAGIYAFSFTVQSKLNHDTDVSLRKGVTTMARGRWGDHSWHTGGHFVILNVEAGEDIYLFLERGVIESGSSTPQVSFSGLMLKQT